MNILVTDAKGFIGKNLLSELDHQAIGTVFSVDLTTTPKQLDQYCKEADFIFHLASVSHLDKEANLELFSKLLAHLKTHGNACPIMLASSVQETTLRNSTSKDCEKLLRAHQKASGASVFIYRFANLYGKWSTSELLVASFCQKISRNQEVLVKEPTKVVRLCYIDDVVNELMACLLGHPTIENSFAVVKEVHQMTVGQLKDLLVSFKESRTTLRLPNFHHSFEKKLYSTYLSFLPTNQFSYELKMHQDLRGSFTEFIRTVAAGQFSVNISKPGVIKGNHWHHTKSEKFLVVSGQAAIRFRKVDSTEVIEYIVSGNKLEIVDIPVGYTHHIENIGKNDLITIIWVNEPYDSEVPDTYFLEV